MPIIPIIPVHFSECSVWVMASIAVVGNLLVLLGRYFYKSRSNVEHSLYLRHLAASDFLMGIYLTLIACADINFRGEYLKYEEAWRHSSLCAFAGAYDLPGPNNPLDLYYVNVNYVYAV